KLVTTEGSGRKPVNSCHSSSLLLTTRCVHLFGRSARNVYRLENHLGRSLEPGRRLEPLEDLLRFGKERLCIRGAIVANEPLAVLEFGHGEPEGEVVLAKASCSGLEARLLVVHPGAEAVRLGFEEGRPQSRW